MRTFAIVMALIFIVFAVLQYNDPDPAVWIPIYLYAALLSFLYYRGTAPVWLFWASAAIFLVGAIFMWPAHWEGVQLQHGMKTMNIEHGRESLGLGLVVVTLVIYALTSKRPVLAS